MPSFPLLLLLLLTVAHARVIPLPAGVQPEGVTFGRGSNFFATDLRSAAIYLIDVASGLVTTAVPASSDRIGVGLDYHNNSLYVAGGGQLAAAGTKPTLYVYNATTGATVAACRVRENGFVNDVIADAKFAYYTDSFRGLVYKLSISALPKCKVEHIKLPRPAFRSEAGVFRANGIVRFRSGLIVANSEESAPFYVDLRTGQTQQILPSGSTPGIDGLEIVRRKGKTTLYVTQNRLQLVSTWKLGMKAGKVTARFGQNVTSEEFDFPTTVAVARGRLVVANARFDDFAPTDPNGGEAVFSVAAIPV